MNRNLAIALAALVLIFGGGYLAFTMFIADGNPGRQATPGDGTPLVVQARAHDAQVVNTNEIRADEIVGLVERRNEDGTWSPVSAGEILAMTDEIRTGPEAQASFAIGVGTSIDVSSSTALGFIEISDAVSNIRLSDGRVAANSEGRKVRIEVKNSDAVAEGKDGSFAVLTGGEGNVIVAAQRGDVSLSAKGESLQVTEGMQSVVQKDEAPSTPTAIPTSLFLKVKRPRADAKLRSTVVEGTASPGAIVNVGGTRLAVDSSGTFKKRVNLGVGSRDIRVTVVDASGRKETQAVRVISPSANTKGLVEW